MKNPALVLWILSATALFADKNSDLLYFAAAGKTETVKALLDAKANVNTKDDYGWTPLMHAVKYGRTDTVRALLEAKANPSVNADGLAPVDLAVRDLVELFLEMGGEVVLDVAREIGLQEGSDDAAAILDTLGQLKAAKLDLAAARTAIATKLRDLATRRALDHPS